MLAATGCRSSDAPVLIGLAGPFTDPVGAPMKRAAELAVDEINAQGGVRGRPIQLLERNDFANPDSAVFVATDLYNAGVTAVVGHLYSGQTLAAAPVYNTGESPVVALSPSSSAPEVSSQGRYTFRLCPSDLAHGAALARWIRNQLGLERGVVLYLNDDYGRGVRATFADEFNRLRGELLSIDPYLGDTPDVALYLDRMAKRARAQFIVVAGNRTEAEQVLREARKRNVNVPILGADGLEGIEQSGSLAEGTYVSQAYLPSIERPANQKFVAAYQRKYPGTGLPNQPAAATYDAIYLLRDVIGRAGTNRQAVRDALAGVGTSTPAFEGVTGRIAFDSAGDVPSSDVHIGVVRAGTIRLAEGG
ncbi:MAG TPA: branched-chain amino acid ABC transporter substrate-binding protein [Gemmatimonadales bacterium]|nr:branched-chain amino acid ABC transporter substrate-binding protein [Gemmatimonadales bacterium]